MSSKSVYPSPEQAIAAEVASKLAASRPTALTELEFVKKELVEYYEYEVWQNDMLQAGGTCPDLESARSEAAHYAMMYGQDGPVEVCIYGKRLIPADAVEVSREVD